MKPRWKSGQLFLGEFLVPDQRFLLRAPCPCCGGPTYHEDGEFRCLLCARELAVDGVTSDGRVTAVKLADADPIQLRRVAPRELRRTVRALSKLDGTTGLAARVLRLVPRDPNEYAVVHLIAARLAIRRDEVRVVLESLEQQGFVESFTFARGYRTGWRRV